MKITQQEWTRRNFLVSLAGASSAMILTPFSSWANDEIDPRVAGIVAQTMSID